VELNIACAVMGRDPTGRRPKAHIELVGSTVARPWSALERAVRACRDVGIVVTDGDDRIDSMLDRAAPRLPRQHCTFHIHHNVWHRLWQDGIPMTKRDAVIERLLNPVLNAKSRRASLEAMEKSIRLAYDNGWDHTARHLQRTGPHLATWRAVRRGRRPSRMPGRLRPEHTTSVLERVMREVNRRVDPPGNRWVVDGVRAMTNLLLGRRFDHPAWKDLWQDAGNVKTWAELR
jgi:transposase-like protein